MNQPHDDLPTPHGPGHGPGIPTGSSAVGTSGAPSTVGDSWIGPYRLLERLGEGGFGVVHLAEQTSPVRRLVALKVLKAEMDSASVLRRFEVERQALALMDHPGIARVFDAGETPQGRPYFVMELVRGSPITEYCDLHRLPTRDRLRLVIGVCLAVHHAHQKGIIHRDLKPTNILVSVQDSLPAVKVIDFGIAKAVTLVSGEGGQAHTMIGQFIGTPEYMSPEQAESSGTDIDTRTDVYSLGVLLYELLTGQLPIDSERLRRAGTFEIPRILRETEPPKPSTRLLVGSPASSSGTPRLRGIDHASMAREVRGDLDWITMKAMDKDRTRRYESAAAFAADIERHLRHEPVEAGPPSAAYRAAKFVRRNRGAVLASLAIGMTVIGGLALSVHLYRQADRERTSARIETQKTQSVLDFVGGMFESINPEMARGREVTVREVLDVASVRAAASDAAPQVRAEIFEILGGAYHTIGRFDAAITAFERALDARSQSPDPSDHRHAQVLAKLGASLMSADRLDEAATALHAALEGRTVSLGPDHADTLYTRGHLALLAQLQGRNDLAEELLREVIKDQTRVVGPSHTATLESRSQLADLLQEAGKFDEALAEARDIAEQAGKSLGHDSTFTLQARSILGSILFDMGRQDEAESVLRSTLDAKRKVFGPSHEQTLTTANALLLVLTQRRKLDEAVGLGLDTVERSRATLGEHHNNTHSYMSNLAAALTQARRFEEAEALYRAILGSRTATLGPTARGTLATMNSLGNLLCDTGRVEEGYETLDQVRRSLEATLPPDHWLHGLSRSHVGQALLDLKRYDEAGVLLADAYDRLSKTLGENHPHTRTCAKSLADLASQTGDQTAHDFWTAKAGG